MADSAKRGGPAYSTPNVVRVPKAAELVADNLRRSIVRGELHDGDTLPPESSLLAQFGISRPTLREAFRVLESERLISVRRGSHGGAQVHVPDGATAARYAGLVLEHRGTTLMEVFEATALIEAPCAGLIASYRRVADLKLLRAAADDEDSAMDDPAQLLEVQTDFHRLVIELVGNGTLGLMSELLRSIVDTASKRLATRPGVHHRERLASHTGSRAHRKLVELVEARDVSGAEALWRRHILKTGEHLLEGAPSATVLDVLE